MLVRDFLPEAILYRGDPSSIDKFDSSKSGFLLLYTPGIYLTDNAEVAADYTVKDSENVVFKDERATSVQDLVLHYLASMMTTRLGWVERKQEIRNDFSDQLFKDLAYREATSGPWSAEKRKRQDDVTREFEVRMNAAIKKEQGAYFRRAKGIFERNQATFASCETRWGSIGS